MPTDLETAIREALHARADAVVPAQTSWHAPRRRQWVPPALAAAAVVVLAVVISLVVTRRSDHSPAASSPAAAAVGYRWRLVTIEDRYGRLAVPSSLPARVGFSPGGSILADDTINGYFGRYRLTDRGYSPSHVGSTLVGFAGPASSPRGRVISAIESVMFIATTSPTATVSPTLDVRATVTGDTLTLDGTGGHVLTLQRAGPEPDPSSASPTATRS